MMAGPGLCAMALCQNVRCKPVLALSAFKFPECETVSRAQIRSVFNQASCPNI